MFIKDILDEAHTLSAKWFLILETETNIMLNLHLQGGLRFFYCKHKLVLQR